MLVTSPVKKYFISIDPNINKYKDSIAVAMHEAIIIKTSKALLFNFIIFIPFGRIENLAT